jgi:hypothetical protein
MLRAILRLACVTQLLWTVNANVEKTIFLGPEPLALADDVRPGLDDLHLPALTPASSVLESRLAVQFPSTALPHGRESWYLLHGLQSGRRYEVRVCWPATVSCLSLCARACLRGLILR